VETTADLVAMGIPPWMPRGSGDAESPGRLYVWVECGEITGRLIIRPDADRAAVVNDLIARCSLDSAQRAEPRWLPSEPMAALVLLPRGIGRGLLGRGPSDTSTVGRMLAFARQRLESELAAEP
jgi:hypothetical protein